VVFAVDARTGKERWRWDPEVNQTAVRPKICCRVVNRGLALYQGKIIAPIIDGRLEALDAETGKVVWETRVAFPQDQYTLTMAPRIAKGKVIIGASGSEYPVRGFFSAYDANTGQSRTSLTNLANKTKACFLAGAEGAMQSAQRTADRKLLPCLCDLLRKPSDLLRSTGSAAL